MEPFFGFNHFTSHHCWTGSLRHLYSFHGNPISEEMLLGLGEGVGFIYWQTKQTLPFLGGRANIERPGTEGLVKTVARRTGVSAEWHTTHSAVKAEKRLLTMLETQQPVMLVLDMGYLPYFDFGGEEFHFGSHVVVACGYDIDTGHVLLADRDDCLHPLSLEILAQARGSKFKPFPPKHGWFDFDFSNVCLPKTEDMRKAIWGCSKGMLEPPISNIGVRGIRKAAERILTWSDALTEKELRYTCINTAIMINARGGTGGGIFRFMYARFLDQVFNHTNHEEYCTAADQLRVVGEKWETVANCFMQAHEDAHPQKLLTEISLFLTEIASEEEKIWQQLYQLSVI